MITEIEGRPRRSKPTSVEDFNERLSEWNVPIPLVLSKSWDKLMFIAQDFDLE